MIVNRLAMTNRDGSPLKSEYAVDTETKARRLLDENHVLSGIDKKTLMERDGLCAIICINRNSRELLSHFLGLRPVTYTGTALKVTAFDIRDLKLEVKWNQPVTVSQEHRSPSGQIRD
jgi:hypothetical protein